jgi:hypothetical protein
VYREMAPSIALPASRIKTNQGRLDGPARHAGRIGRHWVPCGTMRTELVGQLRVEALFILGLVVGGVRAGGKGKGRRAWDPAEKWQVGVEKARLSFKRQP